jgi:hypothetical protein
MACTRAGCCRTAEHGVRVRSWSLEGQVWQLGLPRTEHNADGHCAAASSSRLHTSVPAGMSHVSAGGCSCT